MTQHHITPNGTSSATYRYGTSFIYYELSVSATNNGIVLVRRVFAQQEGTEQIAAAEGIPIF